MPFFGTLAQQPGVSRSTLRRAILGGWIAIGLTASACSTEHRPTAGIRDSAGIIITDNLAAPEPPRWIVDTIPSLDLSGAKRVDEPVSWSSNPLGFGPGIVLADVSTGQLRIYDSAGRLVRRFGGQGHGPGEFVQL